MRFTSVGLDIQSVQHAFSPTHEIRRPELFVGRVEEIRTGMLALSESGNFLSILGLRGIGKSSIGVQLKLIAEGHTEVPGMLNLDRYLPKKRFDFIVHLLQCDSFIETTSQLVDRLLYGDESNDGLYSLIPTGSRRPTSYKETRGKEAKLGAAFGFEAKAGVTGTREATYEDLNSEDSIQRFRVALGQIQREHRGRSGLFILIDEFDRISDMQHFASLVRACSNDFIKFGIIGIATNITELISDHGSIGRKIDIIPVPRMPTFELRQILDRAEASINSAIKFTDHAKDLIAERAEGFPYFVHLMGKEAMLLAFDSGTSVINEDTVQLIERRLTEGRLVKFYEDIYQKVVGNSQQRELALKAYADSSEDDILATTTHQTLRGMSIKNPARLTTELCETIPPILVRSWKDHYRFSDPVFKIYARRRDWKF
jgi:hypothetical protein